MELRARRERARSAVLSARACACARAVAGPRAHVHAGRHQTRLLLHTVCKSAFTALEHFCNLNPETRFTFTYLGREVTTKIFHAVARAGGSTRTGAEILRTRTTSEAGVARRSG